MRQFVFFSLWAFLEPFQLYGLAFVHVRIMSFERHVAVKVYGIPNRLPANSECLRGASIGFVGHKTAGTAGRSGQTGGKAVGTGSPGDIQKVHITKRGKRGNNIVVPLYVGYCKGLVSGSSFAAEISTVFFSLVCTKAV